MKYEVQSCCQDNLIAETNYPKVLTAQVDSQ